MRSTKYVFIFVLLTSTVFAQEANQYPGVFSFRGHKIGNQVDTTLFTKLENLYFPNYLDGWNYDNCSSLPNKYKGLPIAIWQSKTDSSIVLTLLNNIVINVTVSFMSDSEKGQIAKELNDKFGFEGKVNSYQQPHPLQAYVTYWDLITWKTSDVIVQIGHSNMRMPNESEPKVIKWNMVYSDFILENQIIRDYKKK